MNELLAGILEAHCGMARWQSLREGRGHDCERSDFFALKGVPNPDGELSPGIHRKVELKILRRTPSPIVPAGAIVFDRDDLHPRDWLALSRIILPKFTTVNTGYDVKVIK